MKKRIFVTLFFSVFAALTGVGIVIPLLPVYVHQMGASGISIGLIFGAFSLSRTFFLPYFGKLSDIKGRKPFLAAGLIIYAFVSVAFIFSRDANAFIVVRFLQGIASAMILPVAQAYVGEICPPDKEGFVMGLFNLSLYGSLSLGPVMGGLIKDHFGIEASFLCMGILAIVGFLLCLLFLPPIRHERLNSRKQRPLPYLQLLKNKEISGLFVFRLAYSTCIGIVWVFLPIIADEEFALSSSAIGILVMLGVFISGVLQAPMGYMADRLNKILLVVLGGVITSAAILSLEFAKGFWGLFGSNVIFGLGGGIGIPSIMAISVIKGRDTSSMGSLMALLTMAHSIGMLLGSLIAGAIMDIFDLHMAFIFGGIIMAVGTGIFSILNGKSSNCAVTQQ